MLCHVFWSQVEYKIICFIIKMAGVREEDYEHARRVWKEFGLKDMGEYHDLYLKTDVILVANIFEEFRKSV